MLKRILDYWSFFSAVLERMDRIHMGLISAGVAFYSMLAVFPGIAAIISIWSLWFDPTVVLTYLDVAHEFIPEGAAKLIDGQVRLLTSAGKTTIGWTSLVSFVLATFSARAGVNALVRGLNAAYGVRSHPSLYRFVLAYVLTLAIIAMSVAGLATIVIVPLLLNFFTLGPLRAWLLTALPWAGMFALLIIGIGIIYRYGPNVKKNKTPIFTWGALIATLVWAGASIGFSAYLSNFNSYNRIYGSIGTVIALLMWLYLAGFSVMLGAVINVELYKRRQPNAPLSETSLP